LVTLLRLVASIPLLLLSKLEREGPAQGAAGRRGDNTAAVDPVLAHGRYRMDGGLLARS